MLEHAGLTRVLRQRDPEVGLSAAPRGGRGEGPGFLQLPLVQIDVSLILATVARSQKMSFSFWDALIVEAALKAGADRLLTEDMQHGQLIEGMRVENPFL
jgi:hypothetical protein